MLFQDGNGYIDEQELDALLKDLYKKHKMVLFLINYIAIIFRDSDFV